MEEIVNKLINEGYLLHIDLCKSLNLPVLKKNNTYCIIGNDLIITKFEII